MGQGEIDAIRALLSAKPRPVGWGERRQRLDEVGSVWPAATDVKLEPVDLGGVPGEWSSVAGSDASRVLIARAYGRFTSGPIGVLSYFFLYSSIYQRIPLLIQILLCPISSHIF